MTTAQGEWNWLFEEGDQLKWHVMIPDIALIGRYQSETVSGFSVFNPNTGANDHGEHLPGLLMSVCPEVDDWSVLLAQLRREKTEDPLDKLEAVAVNLEEIASGLMAYEKATELTGGRPISLDCNDIRENAARIRAYIRRIRSLPQRARLSDQQIQKATTRITAALYDQREGDGVPDLEQVTIAQVLREALG